MNGWIVTSKFNRGGSIQQWQRLPVYGLIRNLTLREIRSQYKRTTLGRLWSLLNPLATIIVFAAVFGMVFRGGVAPGINSGINSFAIWIGIGVICWSFISMGIAATMNSLVSNEGLLKKVYFPRFVLPLSKVLAATINHLPEIFVLLIIVTFVGGPSALLYAPLLIPFIIMAACIILGIGLVLSVALVYFRDVQHLWNIFSQIWMYSSGVIFPISMLKTLESDLFLEGYSLFDKPLPLVTIFRLNPMELMLEAYRAILFDFTVPPAEVWLGCFLWSAGLLVVGYVVFKRHSGRVVEEL